MCMCADIDECVLDSAPPAAGTQLAHPETVPLFLDSYNPQDTLIISLSVLQQLCS